jgi:hypothetical protein
MRLLDLVIIQDDKNYGLSRFISTFQLKWADHIRTIFPGIPSERGRVTSLHRLFEYLGLSEIEGLKSLLLASRHKKTQQVVKESSCARLVHFPDGAGKNRYIAIGNWLLQAALYPVHVYFSSILKGIPQDCTFEQSKVYQFAAEIQKAGKPIYSLDLSAATDRIPLALQSCCMDLALGHNESSLNIAKL